MNEGIENTSHQTIDKPHITYAFGWISFCAAICFVAYFAFQYILDQEENQIEIRKIDLQIKEKEAEIAKFKSDFEKERTPETAEGEKK